MKKINTQSKIQSGLKTESYPQKSSLNKSRTKKGRLKMMTWSLLFIIFSAMILPTSSYLFSSAQSFAQNAAGEDNQRANFWRAVREGQEGYSAVSGPEAGVFINNGGQNWRQVRNNLVTTYGGWVLLATLGLIALFYIIKGKIRVHTEKSGVMVPRWTLFERSLHWYTAILFILLSITGLSMLFGRAVLIPLLGPEGFAGWASLSISIHNVVGPFFSIGVFGMLIFWVKNNIPNATDMKWLAMGGGIIGNAHPSAGKANAGEKIWFWLVILVGLLAVCGSGLILIGWAAQLGLIENTRATMQFMHQVHAISAIIWMAAFFGHAYIGTLGTEGALEGMTTGEVSVEWAKQHHDMWYRDVKNQTKDADEETLVPTAADASTT